MYIISLKLPKLCVIAVIIWVIFWNYNLLSISINHHNRNRNQNLNQNQNQSQNHHKNPRIQPLSTLSLLLIGVITQSLKSIHKPWNCNNPIPNNTLKLLIILYNKIIFIHFYCCCMIYNQMSLDCTFKRSEGPKCNFLEVIRAKV